MDFREVKTSVIIPVYNTKEYLDTCIKSVLRQTQKDIEIILVDDGSTDGSNNVIELYEKEYPFVKAIYQENKKLGAARNTGVMAASGKYIYFLDSDDYIQDNLLEQCYRIAEEKKLDFVMFDGKTFLDGDESELRPGSAREVYDRRNMGIGDKIYSGIEFWDRYQSIGGVYPNAYLVYINANFLKINELFFEPEVYYEDNDWMIRMLFYAKRICYISQQFYLRRFHSGSIMTANYNEVHLRSCILLCQKLMDMLQKIYIRDMWKMITPVLETMLWRFKEIAEVCNKCQIFEDNLPEILRFYKSLFDVYREIDTEETKISALIILIADTIKIEVQKLETLVKVPDFGLEEYKKSVIMRQCQRYELHKKEKVVGIYGTGLVCERFLDLYKKYVGEIYASIFFIDSYVKTGDKYQGYPLYNIKDIRIKKIDAIIIASTRYREIMERNIKEQFPELVKKEEILYISEIVRNFM